MASLSWDFFEAVRDNGEPSSPKFRPIDAAVILTIVLGVGSLLYCYLSS